MKSQCVKAVQAAAKKLGRPELTESQIRAVDDRISATMRQLARTDKDWQSKTTDQRITQAAVVAMNDIRAEALRKLENGQRQIIKTAATESRIVEAMRAFDQNRSGGLVKDMDLTSQYITGVKQEALGHMAALMDAVKDGQGTSVGRRLMMFALDVDNPQMSRDLATEIFRRADGSTKNKVAQEGAKAYLDTIEGLRTRFNSAGGDVGRLEYGYIPQPHDAARVRGAGTPEARDAWVEKMLPKMDRSRYMQEDGMRMSDAQLGNVLRAAWETISSDGANKRSPGAFSGTGARANKGSDARQIHFKDADAYMAYMQDYGTGSMYDAIVGHLGVMSRDIGLVERYGPNPNSQMRLQFDLAERADGGVVRSFGMRPESYWDTLNGVAGTAQSAKIAQLGTDLRNIQTFGKLGGAVISSITDMGTYFMSTGYNKLSYWDAFKNIAKSGVDAETKDFMTAHGIIAESMIGDMNRWTGDNIRQTWSGRLAQSTLKLSLMNAWTDTMRRAFSLTMMQGLARMSKTEWGNLTEWDRARLSQHGIGEADWQVVTRAELTEFGGAMHLTPESIRASLDRIGTKADEAEVAKVNEVVAKVLGLIQDESEFAVINPDLTTKTMASGGATQRGTIRGELARSVMQFKSFPIAMVSRHWRRMLDTPQVSDGSAPMMANRMVYAGGMLVTTTALGAIAAQVKQIVSGKDPIDMEGPHAGKFWLKALAQGGGLSIVGDLLLNDPADSPGDVAANAVKTLAGPGIGAVSDLALKVGLANMWQAAHGKTTHAAAEAVQWTRGNLPFINIWYAKAALDHAGLHALQENLSPGYLSKLQSRARKDFGQDFWWTPGTGAPDRAPDLQKAVGQ